MKIRNAQNKDIPRLIELLSQVLQIHADIRPDIFIAGTTKYTHDELAQMIKDDKTFIFVAVDENDVCLGYAFCQLKSQPFSNNMVQFTSMFIDDLCVDENCILGSSCLSILRGKQHGWAAMRSPLMSGLVILLLKNSMSKWGWKLRKDRWSISYRYISNHI